LQQNITEYPLISRAKGTAAFKQTFVGFLHSLILTIAKSGTLYEAKDQLDNIASWISVMSSMGNRPFRHTATAAALAFTTALAAVAQEVTDIKAQTLRQIEGEKKKSRSANKARINEMEKKAREVSAKKIAVDFQITQWVHAVFVHRYRDVDPHIRLDCIQALGDWVAAYPEMFFEGSYLRYFGWVLSDLNAPTRHEVLRCLTKLYQDTEKINGMRLFTERFRPRLVEMATQDSDPHVRSSSIHLLDILRASGYLEPDDIDSIGRLIFDNEPRVRKAVINFFAQNVEDAYDLLIEDIGGAEALEEALGPADLDDEDFDSPRVEWLKLKCLVDVLVAYDAEDEVDPRDALTIPGTDTAVIIPAMESRFSLAAENLADRIPELKWEILAGYLLYDHSRTPTQNGVANGTDTTALLKQKVKPSEQEEVLLLEVLYASVKLDLGSYTERAKKATKAQKVAEQDAQELASRHLAGLIPRLLNKFGALPDAASPILRLVHLLDPEAQDGETYGVVLEEVKKQFLTHASPRVLEDALMGLLRAMNSDSEDIARSKITSLVDDAVVRLNQLAQGVDLTSRGNMVEKKLIAFDGVVLRLELLGRIADLGQALESAAGQGRKKGGATAAPIDALIATVSRGIPVSDMPPRADRLEDSVALHSARAVGVYFVWKVRTMQKQLAATGVAAPAPAVRELAARKQRFTQAVTRILGSRRAAEELRLVLAGALVDHYVAFASLVHVKPPPQPEGSSAGEADEAARRGREHLVLVAEVPRDAQALLLGALSAAERTLARRTNRTLGGAEDEADNTDDEPEDEPEDDYQGGRDVADQQSGEGRLAAALVAEQRLCELAGKLVLGVWADVLDGRKEGRRAGGAGAVRRRLGRNRTRLGANFKAVVDALQRGAPHGVRAPAAKATAAAAMAAKKAPAKRKAPVEEEEESEREADEAEEEEREDSAEREALDMDLDSILGD
jgi:cohesin complex subunit SA-1/2